VLFVTRLFGVTGSEAERNLGAEQAYTEEIVEKILLMQANAAAKQHRPLGRGTHAKGVTARAQFEVFDVTVGRDRALAERLARGIFATPGIYPATVRFANSDPQVNSDFKADVRSLSFFVDLTRDDAEQAYTEEIVEKILLMQANAAAKQRRPLASAAKKQCGRSAGRTGPPSRRR